MNSKFIINYECIVMFNFHVQNCSTSYTEPDPFLISNRTTSYFKYVSFPESIIFNSKMKSNEIIWFICHQWKELLVVSEPENKEKQTHIVHQSADLARARQTRQNLYFFIQNDSVFNLTTTTQCLILNTRLFPILNSSCFYFETQYVFILKLMLITCWVWSYFYFEFHHIVNFEI